MSGPFSALTDGIARLSDRRAEARRQALLRRVSEGLEISDFAYHPPERDFGDFACARAALKGELVIGGFRMKLTDLTPWEAEMPTPALSAALHRFDWLADMAALGGKSARGMAHSWLLGWLDRFDDGSGPGWEPETTGLRLIRVLTHLPFIEPELLPEHIAHLQGALSLQTAYLAETWDSGEGSRPRFAALAGLTHGVLCLGGFRSRVPDCRAALTMACSERITPHGGIAGRNPEDLLAVFRHLLGLRELFDETGIPKLPALDAAIARIAPALRTMRHSDGTLARFHGGAAGPEGGLDRALAESRVRTRPGNTPSMGYLRLHGGRVSMIVDCARPSEHSDTAHASTLSFELCSGRRPVMVNCGPALPHLAEWRRSPRTTSAHNTLALDKTSSSRFGPARVAGRPGLDGVQTRPSMVSLARAEDATGMWIQARHDGYLEDYGLLHERRLFVGALGHQIHGEDVLLSPDAKARRRFLARIKGAAKLGVALSIHFHLHPDVKAEIARESDLVRLTLKSGEVWQFRHQGGLMDLEASAYLDPSLPEPVPTRQIVLSSRATTHSAEISWSLIREHATGRAPRDLGIDAPAR